MMTKKVLGLLFVLLLGIAVAGETGRIRGRVVDAKTGEPLIGANVLVEGTMLGAATDINGEYLISNVPAGNQTLIVSYVGYQTQRRSNVLVMVDQTIKEDFRLSPGTVEMGVVEVKGKREAIVRTDPTTSRYMTTDEFTKMPVATLADIVRLQAGVVTSPAYGQHLRGGRPDEVMYYVDGVATSDPLFGYQAARVNPEATAEVVVVSGGFDAEYGKRCPGLFKL